jgi:hypothetical protein
LKVSSLNIQHKHLSKPLALDIKLNSDISLNENALGGYLKAEIHNSNGYDFPVEKADISLQFNDLPADAFIAFSEANDTLDNLHQHAQWALEELGEVPEGQDQIWLLYDRIEESSNILPQILAKQLTENDENVIQLKATTTYKGASSKLEGGVKLNSDHSSINSWLSLLDGEAQVELDKYLLKAVQKFLPITNTKFTLLLKDNKVLMVK